jgi:hypothetical protein
MATAFVRRGAAPEQESVAEVDKLHVKIGRLLVERDFWPPLAHVNMYCRAVMPRTCCPGRDAKTVSKDY